MNLDSTEKPCRQEYGYHMWQLTGASRIQSIKPDPLTVVAGKFQEAKNDNPQMYFVYHKKCIFCPAEKWD